MTAVAAIIVFEAANLWASNPTFTPYNLNNDIVGGALFVVGLWLGIANNAVHSLPMVRLALKASAAVTGMWGLANTEQFREGQASLALPGLYVFLAIVCLLCLTEPALNPLTDQRPEAQDGD